MFGEQRVAEADAALTRIENAVKALDWLLETGTPRGEAALEPETAAEALAATLDAAALSDRVAVLRDGFTEAMDDDFNAPAALGEIFSFVSDVNALVADAKTLAAEEAAAVRAARDAIVELMDVLGIDVAAAEVGRPIPWKWWRWRPIWPATTATTGDRRGAPPGDRATARAEKNWAVADGVRNGLADGASSSRTPRKAPALPTRGKRHATKTAQKRGRAPWLPGPSPFFLAGAHVWHNERLLRKES
ncbi:MAG: DALR domain-containing protein [Adlercreutzia equolifaciens]